MAPWSPALSVVLALTLALVTVRLVLAGFQPHQLFTVGLNPKAVAIGDLNADGKQDLVTANRGGFPYTISVLLNTSTVGGALNFAGKVDFEVENTPYHVAIGDLNADGKPDVVSANAGGGVGTTVSVYLNTTPNGGATPTFATRVDFTVGPEPSSVAIGDLDNDGKPDLAVANTDEPGGTTVSVLLNTTPNSGSAPSFATKVDFTVGVMPYSIAIGDLDGDGKPDLATANWGFGSGSTVSVLRNTTTTPGAVSFAAKLDVTVGVGPVSVAIGDLNADGKLDLVTANFGTVTGNTVSVLRNTTAAAGPPSFAPKDDVPVGSGVLFVAVGDLNGDGKPDIAAANTLDNNVTVLRNDSPAVGALSFLFQGNSGVGINPGSVAIGDLNADGKPELATSNTDASSGTTVSVLRANASGSPSFSLATTSWPEDAGNINIQLERGGSADGQMSVIVSVTGGSATAGQDFTFASPQTVTWADNDADFKTISIPVIQDQLAEGAETVQLTLSLPANPFGATLGGQTTHTMTITNVTPPAINVSPTTGLTTTEAGGTAQFTVALNTAPSANVSIGLSSSNPSEGTVSPSSLTFTPANALTPQTVTVTGVDDAVMDGAQSYTVVTAAATSADSNYNGRNAADVAVTNQDNDVVLAPCTPRPAVVTQAVAGAGGLQVTINATPLNTQAPNPMSQIRFGAFQNARVTLNGQAITSGQTVTLPANTTTFAFTVQRQTPGQATTVPFTVTDTCGPWESFVGGGANAGF